MGLDKHRRKQVFLDGFSAVGSVGFGGPVAVNSTLTVAGSAAFAGRVDLATPVVNGKLTVNSVPYWKGNSSATTAIYAFAGITQIGCGVASVPVSCTIVKSNAFIQLTPVMRSGLPVAQASGSIPLCLCVTSVSEAVGFVIGWLGGVGATNAVVDACWEIKLQG